MPFTFIGETPRTKSKYDLRLQGAEERGAIARTRLSEAGALERTKVQEAESTKRDAASKYAAVLAEQDKRDYEMAHETWVNFGNMTGKQQEEFKTKTEAYTATKKLLKRQGLEVFDDKGEVIFPPSKADAAYAVKEAFANAEEGIRAGRKPSQQEMGNIIGALNNARELATSDDEANKLDQLLIFFETELGEKAGVKMVDPNDPIGLLNLGQ